MWTTGVQGFDTLPYIYIWIIWTNIFKDVRMIWLEETASRTPFHWCSDVFLMCFSGILEVIFGVEAHFRDESAYFRLPAPMGWWVHDGRVNVIDLWKKHRCLNIILPFCLNVMNHGTLMDLIRPLWITCWNIRQMMYPLVMTNIAIENGNL